MTVLLFILGCVEEYPLTYKNQFVDRPDEDFDNDGYTELEGDVYPDGRSADDDASIHPNAENFAME